MGPQTNRRKLLSGIAGVLPALLSGCSSTDHTPTSSPTPPPHSTGTPTRTTTPTPPTESPTNTPTETPTDTPSPEPTPTPRPARDLGFGSWYTTYLDFTVVGGELLTQFEVEYDDRTYEMPDDRQLLVATTRIRNDDSEAHWSRAPFVALAAGTSYREQKNFDHPELGYVETDDLPRIEHSRQFSAEGVLVEEGETATAWTLYVVPRKLGRPDVEIAFEYRYAEAHEYPIRWIPGDDG